MFETLLAPVAGLFDVDSVEAMALRLLGAALVLLAAFWISRAAQSYLVRRLRGHDTGEKETVRLYRQVVQVCACAELSWRRGQSARAAWSVGEI